MIVDWEGISVSPAENSELAWKDDVLPYVTYSLITEEESRIILVIPLDQGLGRDLE